MHLNVSGGQKYELNDKCNTVSAGVNRQLFAHESTVKGDNMSMLCFQFVLLPPSDQTNHSMLLSGVIMKYMFYAVCLWYKKKDTG